MYRVRLAAVIGAGAMALAALCLPAAAHAGTYTWNVASDFTASSPGANPGHDHYGAAPWSYAQGPGGSLDPRSFQPLSAFDPSFQGGVAGWASDSTPSPAAYVAINPTGSPIISYPSAFPPGQIAVLSAPGRSAAVAWTSPLSHIATIRVTGTVTSDTAACVAGINWNLAQSGALLQAGANSNGTISASATINPGATIALIVNAPSLPAASCAAGLALQIQATESVGPAVAVTSPGYESITSAGQPKFRGTADGRFGASSRVTVRVYSGAGSLLQTLTTAASGGAWSIDPSPPLADGVYIVQAEQDDLASPPDAGLSPSVAFVVHNAPPTLELDSPGGAPLQTATPTLRGVAGTARGSSAITLVIYPGSGETASPVRTLVATADAQGRFAATVAPALSDGQYTAAALQTGPTGSTEVSPPRAFRVKLHGPILTLDLPASGSATGDRQPIFAGRAGISLGDSPQIEVPLYAGKAARGRLVGTLHVPATGAHWSRRWPRRLPVGLYTAEAVQRDDAGHTSGSRPHTFRILSPPSLIGAAVGLDRAGNASLSVTCPEPAGQTCTGTVRILSTTVFQPVAGGPIGRVLVVFTYVSIPGGKTALLQRPVPSRLAKLFRAHSPLRVRITATFGDPTRHPTVLSALRVLRPR